MRKLTCDGCGRESNDVVSCGRDGNGEPDAPDLCFICRKEHEKGRFFSKEKNRYCYYSEKLRTS